MSSARPPRALLLLVAELTLSAFYVYYFSKTGVSGGHLALFQVVALAPLVAVVVSVVYGLIASIVYTSVVLGALNSVWLYFLLVNFTGSAELASFDNLVYLATVAGISLYFVYSKLLHVDVLKYLAGSVSAISYVGKRGWAAFVEPLPMYFYSLAVFNIVSYYASAVTDLPLNALPMLPANIVLGVVTAYIYTAVHADGRGGVQLVKAMELAAVSSSGLLAPAILLSELLYGLSVDVGYRFGGVSGLMSENGLNLGVGLGVARRGRRICPVELKGFEEPAEDWYWACLGVPLKLDPGRLVNSHMIVAGSSGMGKTTFVKSLVRDIASRGDVDVLVFDPHNEYVDLLETLGARSINPRQMGVNILYLGLSSPRERARRLADIVSSFFNLGPLQRRALEELIVKAYERKGIVDGDERTWTREPPSLRDLVEMCESEPSGKPSCSSILPYVKTLEEAFYQPQATRGGSWTLEGSAIINLSDIPDDYTRFIYVDTILQLVLSQMYSRSARRRLVIVLDEAALLMRSRAVEDVMSRLYMESRKFGFSVILVVQNPYLLPESIIVNSGIRVVFGLGEPRSVSYAARILSPGGPPGRSRLVEKTLANLKPGYYLVGLLGSENIFLATRYKPTC
ncbi:ATP-binding protein [Thermogladius sp.]|uniref:ATP-binding protein n=1 Tax=Thermogladius sp. TaxID=2023064 RepID=UPI003D0AD890